jgi:SAM-dependent methyltransferase
VSAMPGKQPIDLLKALTRTAPFQPATNYWRAVELEVVRRRGLRAERALDLGCGDGKLTSVLRDALTHGALPSKEWIGIDIDPLEAEQASETGLYARIHICSAAAIPEVSESFDLVFSNSVLEHIPPIKETLAEVGRLLKVGGRFIFTVPGPDFHACLNGPMTGGAADSAYFALIDSRCAHLRYWDLEKWRQELASCGMTVVFSDEYLTRRQTQRWERLSAMTGGLLYGVFGRSKRPIEIQRRLRMRSAGRSFFGTCMSIVAPLLTIGASMSRQPNSGLNACLYVEAVKG